MDGWMEGWLDICMSSVNTCMFLCTFIICRFICLYSNLRILCAYMRLSGF